ncbi:NrdH-redoxin [Deinococcus sp. YIM 134068]|uniref:NrdH-redoxin n=1 Tax=Deinococcus lichenicola TaxID=3118910 RepID=UPI002F9536AE
MAEIPLYTVPNGANGQALQRLLTHPGAPFTQKEGRGDPELLAEMQARADVRMAPVTVAGAQAFFGPFDEQRPWILAALQTEAP